MKKFIALVILVAICSLSLFSCNTSTALSAGCIEDGDKLYVVADGAYAVIENGVASPLTEAPEGTPVSKKFNAPDTTEAYFTYKEISGKINITGLSAKGKAASVIVLPKTVDGKAVAMVSAGAFDGLSTLVIANPESSVVLANGALKGIGKVFFAADPNKVEVGAELLTDSDGVKIYVSADEYANFSNHYNWKEHKDSLTKY